MHWGHLEILRRAKEIAGADGVLIVGVSTDEFNKTKHKKSYHDYRQRRAFVEAMRCVDKVIPEKKWAQKKGDFKKYDVDILVMGDDWKDSPEFVEIKGQVETRFLPRTPSISSTQIRDILSQ
jgi:glycerol-3-phosphate cytidylyltransferase